MIYKLKIIFPCKNSKESLLRSLRLFALRALRETRERGKEVRNGKYEVKRFIYQTDPYIAHDFNRG